MAAENSSSVDVTTRLPRGLHHVAVSKRVDAYLVGATARAEARTAGFGEAEVEEIVLCAVELATNMSLHAGEGVVSIRVIEHAGRQGIEMFSEDRGPGIPNVEVSFADGTSRRGGLGCGLGTVHRLMDNVEVRSPTSPTGGTSVRCSRMTTPGLTPLPDCPLDVGAVTRAHPGFTFNGDTFVIKAWERNILVGIIDGLGHGQFANKAALSAQRYLESHFDLDLFTLFLGVDRACRATRGVVMALALFDWELSHVTLAAVGNVEVRHWGPSKFPFVSRRGYLGSGIRPITIAQRTWTPEDVLVMASDGMHSAWSWTDHPDLVCMPAHKAAKVLLDVYARDNDDATVLVVKRQCRPKATEAAQ